MPKGVEHVAQHGEAVAAVVVSSSVMPKGVEHAPPATEGFSPWFACRVQ